MANNRLYGYTPKTSNEKDGNRLDNLNPHEFRKGMDYELTAMGCMRLAESTPEEREKATESVIKNLESHGGYYSGLIQYETEFRNKKSKPNFKSWLKEFTEEYNMKEVDKKFSYKHTQMAKSDKMEELKESVRKEIKKALYEDAAKKAAMSDMDDEEGTSKKGKGKGKEVAKKEKPARKDRFDKEEDAIKDILFRVDSKIDKKFYCPEDKEKTEAKGEEEDNTMEDPAKGSLLYIKDCLMKEYTKIKADTGGDLKAAKEAYDELQKEANEEFEDIFTEFAEEFSGNDVGEVWKSGDHLFQTIKKLQERLKLGLNKARAGVEEESRGIRRQVAETEMTRTEGLRLLEIIRENGISLREGSENIKIYYEIAKASYLEGVANALKL